MEINILNLIKITFTILLFFFGITTLLFADQTSQIVGSWCFYEQTGFEQTFPEKVDITFHKNGSYDWEEGPVFKQKGAWSISQDKLIMSNVGTHKILSLNENDMKLERGSIMKFRKGKCDKKNFSDQDITAFHNAASTGDIKVIKDYLNKGIDVNIADWNRGDTALIKAAKFCKVKVAKFLIKKNANKNLKNENDKSPLDYAKSSIFHEGCDELVKFLQ